MLTFLFWNINQSPLVDAIVAIAEAESVDILILAECAIHPVELLKALNREEPAFHFSKGRNDKIAMFTRFPGHYLAAVHEGPRFSIRRTTLPAIDEFLLVAVHFPSKLFWSAESQAQECTNLSNTISEVEEQVGHRRTIVVGDLNMNPFEQGVVGAAGLHAVASRAVVARGERVVQERTYPFFYNPMWGHFGDDQGRPSGTYYYERAEHVNYFWNNFDQVMVRPELVNAFRTDQLKILDRAGEASLALGDGRPDAKRASDHFPLLFALDL
jgi:endonuclease/exonuclease/phosphatase (EEP) superfamily protein YafD